ncbi:response regulator transcription factor [Geojedonia litorea]|uniref:Response regulator transcription factor n=1 Tax=Geojedonia litorea TaxID=1268269 RepID=A0ABV9N2Z2_9FLAO
MKKTVLVFSLLIFALLLLFQISNYAIVSGDANVEIIVASVAFVFFFVGVFIHKKSLKTKESHSKEINHKKIQDLEITDREYQVLQGISQGLSNKEIAVRLFLTESTIKTHVSNLLLKLNAKRRTQALQIAKDFQII